LSLTQAASGEAAPDPVTSDTTIGSAASDIVTPPSNTQGGNNTLEGLAGDDFIRSYGGDDILLGGRGDDVLEGGKHRDFLYGEQGNDRLYGDKGNDMLWGDSDYLDVRKINLSSFTERMAICLV
ncbi:MAG: hypothetical protein COB23_10150, partial [Methylophaga sp.]